MASNKARQIAAITALGGMGYAMGQSAFRVPEGHAGIVVNTATGESQGPLGAGVHFRVPFRDVAAAVDMRPSEREVLVEAACSDGLKLAVTLCCSVKVQEVAGSASPAFIDGLAAGTL